MVFLVCNSTTVLSKTPLTSNIFATSNADFSQLFKYFNVFSNPQEFASNLHLFVYKHNQLNRQTPFKWTSCSDLLSSRAVEIWLMRKSSVNQRSTEG